MKKKCDTALGRFRKHPQTSRIDLTFFEGLAAAAEAADIAAAAAHGSCLLPLTFRGDQAATLPRYVTS